MSRSLSLRNPLRRRRPSGDGHGDETGWLPVATSVRGPSHKKTGKPNQDAYGIRAAPDGQWLAVAVADGHGGKPHDRSEVGSGLAVAIALDVLEEILDGQPSEQSISTLRDAASDRLPRDVVHRWRTRVLEHIGNSGPRERGVSPDSMDDEVVRYGSTLLACGLNESVCLYLQIGDGDILVVDERGRVARPIAKSPKLFGNETTSLCDSDAWREVEFVAERTERGWPALVVLCSDGYSNSFQDEAGFLRVGADLLHLLRDGGITQVEKNLPEWLDESANKSGDDVTVALAVRAATLNFYEAKTMTSESGPSA